MVPEYGDLPWELQRLVVFIKIFVKAYYKTIGEWNLYF
jgi:hypothetical protein